MWGRGEYGRLGLGDDCADKQRPVELTLGSWGGDPRPPRIIDAALGGTHSCLLDESGVVYSFGRNSLGRLGQGTFLLPSYLLFILTTVWAIGLTSCFVFFITGCSRQVEWRAGARELPATPGRWRVAGHVRGGGRAAHVGDRAEGEPGSG